MDQETGIRSVTMDSIKQMHERYGHILQLGGKKTHTPPSKNSYKNSYKGMSFSATKLYMIPSKIYLNTLRMPKNPLDAKLGRQANLHRQNLLAFFFHPPLTFQCTTSRHIVSVRRFGGGVVGIAVLGIAVLCCSVVCCKYCWFMCGVFLIDKPSYLG